MNPTINSSDVNVPDRQATARVPQVPWGWRDMLLAIAVAAAGIVVLNLIVLAVERLLHVPVRNSGDLLAIFVIVQDLVVVATAWLFSVARYRLPWDRLGLRPYSTAAGCLLSISLLLASYVIRLLYGVLAVTFGWQIQQQQVVNQLDMHGTGFLLTFVGVAIVAPIAEEIFFRGFLYGGLRSRLGVAGAMVVSAAFFTTLHLSIDLFIPIFILGLFLAWLYESTGSLYPGMFLHAANNAISLVLLFVIQAMGGMPALPLQTLYLLR